MQNIAAVYDTIIQALYPQRCVACDTHLRGDHGMCPLCLESCERIDVACRRCARPLHDNTPPACCPCVTSPSSLASCTASFEYGGQIAVALRRLKFSGRNDIARGLSGLLHDGFARASARCDIAIAVPLDRSRLRKRGFNQAQRLLVPLAKARHIAQPRGALVRSRATPEQSRLSRRDRVANLKEAFRANPAVRGKNIVLLDDVRTTGATLESAARALRRAGASEIHGFVVARTEWEG